MATIVILEHLLQKDIGLPYMAHALADMWRTGGHRVLVHHGTDDPPDGDVALLHVDLTVVPTVYRDVIARYPRVINGSLLDISKRQFSQLLVIRDDPWPGPVIVKTDANFGGKAEQLLRARAIRLGLPCDIPVGPVAHDYPVFRSIAEVPYLAWNTPGLVVEKFVPESAAEGYYIHHWTFLGTSERCARFRANAPIIKSENFVGREAAEVPATIRAWRDRLGVDYGKLDYLRMGDDYVLIDVNRTPSVPMIPNRDATMTLQTVAQGIDAFLAG